MTHHNHDLWISHMVTEGVVITIHYIIIIFSPCYTVAHLVCARQSFQLRIISTHRYYWVWAWSYIILQTVDYSSLTLLIRYVCVPLPYTLLIRYVCVPLLFSIRSSGYIYRYLFSHCASKMYVIQVKSLGIQEVFFELLSVPIMLLL